MSDRLGVCGGALASFACSVFSVVMEDERRCCKEEFPSQFSLVEGVGTCAVVDVVANVVEELGEHCVAGFGYGECGGCEGQDVVPGVGGERCECGEVVVQCVVRWCVGRGGGRVRWCWCGWWLCVWWGRVSVNGGWCICRCDDGDVWPCGYEATGVPRVPVVVAVSDPPFAPQEVMVANPAYGVAWPRTFLWGVRWPAGASCWWVVVVVVSWMWLVVVVVVLGGMLLRSVGHVVRNRRGCRVV